MSTMTAESRPYHHGDLSRALIDAARKILENDGPAALSLRAVAREAGVSPAAPYHHFKDKVELLEAVAHEGWHELDLAPFAAVLIFLFSSSLWCSLLEAWLYDDSSLQATGRCPVRYQQCIRVLGVIILLADACLFYRALTFAGWSGNAFSTTALFSAMAYLAILVSVCMVSVNLKRHYLSLKRGL